MHKVLGTIIVALAFGSATPLAAQTPAPSAPAATRKPLVYVGVNAATLAGTQDFGITSSFPLYEEQGTFETQQSVQPSLLADFSAMFRVWGDYQAGVGYAGYNHSDTGSLEAALPHPLIYDSPRTVTSEADSLSHRERAINVMVGWRRAFGNNLDATITAGPTIFLVKQDFLTGLAFSEVAPAFTTVTVDSVNRSTVEETVPGFNIGGDVTYMFSRMFGAGAFVRYSAATLDVKVSTDTTVSLDLGGFQFGGGLRFRF